jgi:hypothetical protein
MSQQRMYDVTSLQFDCHISAPISLLVMTDIAMGEKKILSKQNRTEQ